MGIYFSIIIPDYSSSKVIKPLYYIYNIYIYSFFIKDISKKKFVVLGKIANVTKRPPNTEAQERYTFYSSYVKIQTQEFQGLSAGGGLFWSPNDES